YFSDDKLIKIYNNLTPVFPNFLLEDLDLVLKFYNLRKLGLSSNKIANKKTHVFELKSKDGLRWGVKFWVCSETGLILKLHYFDGANKVLKKEFFADISIDPKKQLNLNFSTQDSKNWRKIYISSIRNGSPNSLFDYFGSSGFSFINCLDTKYHNSKVKYDTSLVHQQCLFSDGVAIVSVVTQNSVRPIKIFQRSNGCMSEKVGLKDNKPLYVGGCVPKETIKYFFNKLSVD
ncbi:MAG: hypothetical protein CBD16_04295, partial [Betaproteobacteria bacterium TMED156]